MKLFNPMFTSIVVLLCSYLIEPAESLYSEINFTTVSVACPIYRLPPTPYPRSPFFKRLSSSSCSRHIVSMIPLSTSNTDEWNNHKLSCNVFKNGLLTLIVVVVWTSRAGLRHFLTLEFVTFAIWNCLSVWDKTSIQIRMICSSFTVDAKSFAKLESALHYNFTSIEVCHCENGEPAAIFA